MTDTERDLETKGAGEGEGEPGEGKPEVDPSVEAVKEIAKDFTAQLEEFRKTSQAAPAAPEKDDSVDIAAQQKALGEEYQSMLTKYKELCEAGEFDQGVELILGFQRKVATATQGDPTKAPAFKAMVAQARREVKRDNKALFEAYGEEIESEVTRMSPEDRINPDNWDEALRRVKADHIDEILEQRTEEAAKEREERADKRRVSPQAPGSRGSASPSGATGDDLSEEYQEAARVLGYTPDEYAKLVEGEEKLTIRQGFSRGMVNVLDPEKRPAPGEF